MYGVKKCLGRFGFVGMYGFVLFFGLGFGLVLLFGDGFGLVWLLDGVFLLFGVDVVFG